MIRRIVLSLIIAVVAVSPAGAQAHPPHPAGGQHAGPHIRVDSATHAALHALFHGTWAGTTSDAHASMVQMSLSVDSLHRAALTLAGGHFTGSATDLRVQHDTLRWTQTVSGKPCTGVATKAPASTMQILARLTCGTEVNSFKLEKQGK